MAIKFISLIRLIRINQWVKNFFIFLPIFFGQEFEIVSKLLSTFIAFVGFSFVASSIYVFNDIVDIKEDRKHPKKKNRPIASGEISILLAYIIMAITFLIGITILFFFQKVQIVLYLALSYFIMNIAYSIKLKHFAIIDVIIISFGFVIRIFIGGFAADIQLSQWIVIMTFLLALFLGFAKRKDDVIVYEKTGLTTRKNTNRYNSQFIDSTLILTSGIIIVSYIMYSVSPEVISRLDFKYVYLTSVFVISGILRYLQKALVDINTGNPTNILIKDRFIQLCILGWVLSFILIIYL